MTAETETPGDGQGAAENEAGQEAGQDNNKDGKASRAEGADAQRAEGGAVNIPEAYQGDDGEADLAKLIERVTAADKAEAERGEGVPESADGYDLSLPDSITLPDGSPVQLDADSEALKGFLADAHAAGLPQEKVTENLGRFAQEVGRMVTGMQEASQAQIEAEIKKIDADPKAAEARFNAVDQFLKAQVGEAGASAVLGEIRTAEAFNALEALHEKLTAADGGRSDGGAQGGEKSLAERMFGQQ